MIRKMQPDIPPAVFFSPILGIIYKKILAWVQKLPQIVLTRRDWLGKIIKYAILGG